MPKPRPLTELLEGVTEPVFADPRIQEAAITGLTCDSRGVAPGFLFAAIAGGKRDGRAFIKDALGRGAGAILAPPGTPASPDHGNIPFVLDQNPRRRYALMAAAFYGRQPKTVAAVTGTNGKTSTVTFLAHIWNRAGGPAASMGTLGVDGPGIHLPGGLTTPDPARLHAILAELAARGIDRLALEASSHGLDQYRLDGVRIAAAGFTNLSHDHLDYHGGEAAYMEAKRRLFSDLLLDGGVAVLNADAANSTAFEQAARRRGCRILTYGREGRDIRLLALDVAGDGQRLTLDIFGQRASLALPLSGAFQAANALCALGLALATDIETGAALAAMETLPAAPGRLQLVGRTAGGGAVYVDFAHTPDALAAVLGALRAGAAGALSVVFGCGGDRDKAKRPRMGAIAAGLADRVIVTDDNPRTEDAAAIRRQIMAGCPEAREIGDRARAIAAGIDGLAAGDILIIAGKGHETGQIVGDQVMPFNDTEVARALLGGGAS